VVFIYNEILLSHKKNEILSFVDKWMDLRPLTFMKLLRLRKPKTACSLSFVKYRPNTNVAIL
jgi:hypothetical protein